MTHEIEISDYMLDNAVNDATRIWRDLLAAFGHAQEGEETIVRLGTVPVARIVPFPWVSVPPSSFDVDVPVIVRTAAGARRRWRVW